jgi:hypothetical protein
VWDIDVAAWKNAAEKVVDAAEQVVDPERAVVDLGLCAAAAAPLLRPAAPALTTQTEASTNFSLRLVGAHAGVGYYWAFSRRGSSPEGEGLR